MTRRRDQRSEQQTGRIWLALLLCLSLLTSATGLCPHLFRAQTATVEHMPSQPSCGECPQPKHEAPPAPACCTATATSSAAILVRTDVQVQQPALLLMSLPVQRTLSPIEPWRDLRRLTDRPPLRPSGHSAQLRI